MKDCSQGIVTGLLGKRKILLELVIAAVLLALSINMMSSAILDLHWISPLEAFVFGSVLTALCIVYFGVRYLWSQGHIHTFRGFIIFQGDKHEIVNVRRYDYGSNLRHYLQAAFAEDAAIKRMWDKEPVDKAFRRGSDADEMSPGLDKRHQLAVEATEYYVLEALSTHLTDYFNRGGFEKEKLHTFARNDIPDVLLSNRFLELFSKPMEDRSLFPLEENPSHPQGEVVMSISKDGAFYSRFDLTLPKGARVRRDKSNAIIIETDRFTLTIYIDFKGLGTVVPWEYQRCILGVDPRQCHTYQIGVRLCVSFRFASLFLPGGWEYYRWVESFVESFDKDFSEDRYFTDIGWESALTLIEYHEKKGSTS